MRKILLLFSLSMLLLTGCFEKKNGSDIESDSDNLEITNFTEGTQTSSGTVLGISGDATSGSAIIIESSTVIPIDKVVTINFSETIAEQTVNSSTIYIADNAGNPIPATLNVVGTQITIIPNDFLVHDSRYTIVVTTNLKDIRGRGLAGVFNYSFFTEPDIFPILLSVTPVNGSIATPTTDIMMTFSEDIAGNARIVLVNNSTNSNIDGSTTMVGNILRFVATNPLNYDTNYRVTLEGNVEDVDGNIYIGVTSWNFSTEANVVPVPPADTTSPSLVGLTPIDGATDVNKSTVISITFDETISATGVSLEVRESVSGVLVIGTSSVVGDTLTFIPDIDLLDGLAYDVTLLGSAEDLAGNVYIGVSTWSFTVSPLPDTTPPTLLTLTPTDGATDVNKSTSVSITFSETISDNGVTLDVRESINGVLLTGTSSVIGDTLIFTPDSDFLDTTEYNATVIGSVEDLSGNPYTGQSSWSFIVPDTTPPALVSLSPTDGAIDVNKSTAISMTFDENIVRVTMSVDVKESISGISVNGTLGIAGNTLSFMPASDLLDGTEYNVTVQGSLEDVYSNVYTGVTTWSFTTVAVPPLVDTIAPTLVALLPTDAETDVNKSTLVSITFDENISDNGVILEVRDTLTNTLVAGTNSVVGNSLTFTPDSDLADGEAYDVTVLGNLEDLSGNLYAGQSGWSFTVADTIAPLLTSLTPIDGAVDVNKTTDVVITLTENISDNGVILEVRDTLTNTLVAGTNSVVGNSLTFTPDSDLADGEAYDVTVLGNLEDLSGNLYAGQSGWSFTVADTIAPLLTSLTPIDGAVDVNKTTDVVITLTENISDNGVILEVRDTLTNTLVAGTNTISGNSLTFTPGSDLANGEAYNVTVAGSLEDMSANLYSGTDTWSFTVADIIAPTLLLLTPLDGATDVNKSTAVSITLSEDINDNGVILEVRDILTNTLVSGTNSVVGNSLTFTPDSDLADGEAYGVNIVGTVEDLSGNLYVGQNAWSFTVADTIAPLLTSLTPIDGAVDVNKTTDVVITLTENISDNGVILEVRDTLTNTLVAGTNSVVGNSLTFTPDSDLADGEAYDVTVLGNLEDLSGNLYAGQSGWSFTVADTIAPLLTSLTPIDGAVDVNKTTDVVITLTENISDNGVILEVRDTLTNTLVAGTNSVVGNSLTFTPDSDLADGEAYDVTVLGNLEDLSGNLYAGQSGWSFTVADTIAPLLTSLTPIDGAVDVNKTTDVVITLTENISDNGVILEVRDTLTNTLVAGTNSVVGNSLTFTPDSDLADGEAYDVTVLGNLEDLSGNLYAGQSGWSFTVADTIAPLLTSLTPIDGAVDVNKTTDVVITLTENISDNGVILEVRDTLTNTLVAGTNSVVGNSLTFTPDSDLADGEAYDVTVLGNLEDLSGNLYAGQSGWSFTVADTIAPLLTSLTPIDGAVDVNKTTDVVITLTENISDNGVILEVRDTLTNTLVAGTNSVVGNSLTFTPDSDLADGEAYDVTVLGNLEDLSGNLYSGQTSWSFTVVPLPDLISPSLVGLLPTDGATDVNKSTTVSITFDENISDNGVTLEVSETVSGVLVSGTSSVVEDTLIFTPDSDFLDGIEYDVTLLGSAEDIVGNPYTGQSSWNFTVAADVLEPVVAAFFPTDGAINVDINTTIYVTFDENITNGGNIIDVTDETLGTSVSGTEGVTGNTLWFIPDSDLIADHNYSVLIHGTTEDLASNEYTGQNIWTFQTAPLADITPPTLTLLTPIDGDINASTTTAVTMEFSEDITNSGVTLKLLDNTLGANVAGSSGFSGNTLWFIPDNILVEEHNYTVIMQGPTFDLSDNEYIGQISWNFSVKPFAVSSVFRVGDVVTVAFSDKLDPLTVSESDFEIDGGAITFNTFIHFEFLGVVTFISDDPLVGGEIINISGTIQDLNGDSVNDGVPVDYIFL